MSAAPAAVTTRDVFAARRRLHGVARRTPLQRSHWLSDVAGCDVYLKLECWQRTGSFKVRGAGNAVALLPRDALAAGLVAASAGNHGQGVALAARARAARATIFVPSGAPETKKRRIAMLGAELREAPSYDEAEAQAVSWAADTGAHFIHPCADPAVVAGQGTVGLEVIEELPAACEVVAPVGGGGLIAGIAAALRGAAADTRVVGVQAQRARVMHDSLEAGRVVAAPPPEPTLADGLAGGIDAVGLARVAEVADHLALVDEDEIAAAIRELYRHDGVVAEGSAAVVAAAVVHGRVSLGGPAVLIISGGNIDARRLGAVLTES